MPNSRAAAQLQAEQSFASSAMILRALPDGVLLADRAGVVRQINAVAATLLGVAEDALLGMSVADIPGGDALSLHATEPAGTIKVAERWLRFACAPLLSDDGGDSVIGTLITLRDVSAQLAAKQAQYDFVSRALHDVRVPLQAMGGTTEGLLRGWFGPVTDEQREFLGSIKENAARQGDLFSNIFDVYALNANRIPLNAERLHLEGLLHEVAQVFAARCAAATIALTIEVPAGLPTVLGDRRRLRQILVALFENACKYTLPNGQIEVCARPEGAFIRIDVRDTGVGIRVVDQPMIFTPFFRGESPLKEGRYGGLNLAITKMLVALHGGQIWFESVEGQGSMFSFTVPIGE